MHRIAVFGIVVVALVASLMNQRMDSGFNAALLLDVAFLALGLVALGVAYLIATKRIRPASWGQTSDGIFVLGFAALLSGIAGTAMTGFPAQGLDAIATVFFICALVHEAKHKRALEA